MTKLKILVVTLFLSLAVIFIIPKRAEAIEKTSIYDLRSKTNITNVVLDTTAKLYIYDVEKVYQDLKDTALNLTANKVLFTLVNVPIGNQTIYYNPITSASNGYLSFSGSTVSALYSMDYITNEDDTIDFVISFKDIVNVTFASSTGEPFVNIYKEIYIVENRSINDVYPFESMQGIMDNDFSDPSDYLYLNSTNNYMNTSKIMLNYFYNAVCQYVYGEPIDLQSTSSFNITFNLKENTKLNEFKFIAYNVDYVKIWNDGQVIYQKDYEVNEQKFNYEDLTSYQDIVVDQFEIYISDYSQQYDSYLVINEEVDTYIEMYNLGQANNNSGGYQDGYTSGYNEGKKDGIQVGYQQGYGSGYKVGYDKGLLTAENDFNALFSGIANTPIMILHSVLSFDIFGVNIFNIIFSLLTLLLLIWLLKRFI